jgi:hypothetical protein
MQQFRTFGAKFVRTIDLRRLGALVVLALGGFSVWMALSPSDSSQTAPAYTSSFISSNGPDLPQTSPNGSDSARAIYPYSVIPGGVESASELRNSVAHDPVVATHYGDFDIARARVVRLNQDRLLYVSYRLGNRVFWSKNRLTLLKGETVITDGENMARTRCGNRLAEAPVGPVLAAEPAFEAAPPEVAQVLAGAPALLGAPFVPGDVALAPPPPDFGIPPGSGSPGGGIFTPPGAPIGGGGGPPSHRVTPPPGTPPPIPPPPPVPTPEPEMLLMLATGISGLWFGRKKWKG